MSNNSIHIAPPDPDNGTPNQRFLKWLHTENYLAKVNIAAVVSFVAFAVSLIYYATHISGPSDGKPHRNTLEVVAYINPFLQIIFIAYFIFYLSKKLNDNKSGWQRSIRAFKIIFNKKLDEHTLVEPHENNNRTIQRTSEWAVRQFKLYFLWFWVIIGLFYVFYLFGKDFPEIIKTELHHSEHKHTNHPDNHVIDTLEYRITNLKTDYPSIDLDTIKHVHRHLQGNDTIEKLIIKTPQSTFVSREEFMLLKHAHSIVAKGKIGGFMLMGHEYILYVFNTGSIFFIFLCFTVMAFDIRTKKGKHRQHQVIRIALYVLIIILILPIACMDITLYHGEYTEEKMRSYMVFFDAISGVLNATILALLISRLDSKLIGLPSQLVGFLYVYAAVQPLFVVFAMEGFVMKTIEICVVYAVLFFKIYFFFIIGYALQTGRLRHYIISFPVLRKRTESIFMNYFHIATRHNDHGKSNSYYFTIHEQNELAFVSKTFETAEERNTYIEKFQHEIALNFKNYSCQKVQDTTHVVIEYQNEQLCFGKKNFASEEEASAEILYYQDRLPTCRLIIG